MTYPMPEPARRRLVSMYRKRAAEAKSPAERAEWTRMADNWAKTLPKK